jgi:hypothetical protein
MYKSIVKKSLILFVIMALGAPGVILSKVSMGETDGVKTGEIYMGDKFVSAKTFNNDGLIKGDLFIASDHFTSSGKVTGDIIGGGRYVSVPGIVDGSIIGGGEFLKLSGRVNGNIRVIGKDVIIGGTVKKNVIACGSTVNLNSSVNGSLIACGKDIIIDGSVKGDTRIYGQNITLKGTFYGNVFINDVNLSENSTDFNDAKAHLTVMPGAVVHKTLKFKGAHADIQKGAKIKDFQWKKFKASQISNTGHQVKDNVWIFIRMLFVTVILFLIGLLLQKTSPDLFQRMTQSSGQKPLNSLGLGLLGLLSTIPVFIIFVVLMALSVIISPAFGLIFGLTSTGIYVILFYFSIIPAGLWLGNILLKEKTNAPLRLFLGLIILNIVMFFLSLLADLNIADAVFSTLGFVVKVSVLLFGTGVLVVTIKESYRAVMQR